MLHQKKIPSLSYLPYIDGLRALAVLSVVLFHAFPEYIHGGFIGVDIFFVISGFLISSLIFRSLEQNNFSLSEFYSRRVRRIFPALIIVLLGCLLIGWFSLLADEYMQLGKHIAGAATFTNNFMFWKESNYFDNDSATKPLLHLWSLSIEEQFYLLWPLFLCFIFKWKKYLKRILIVSVIGFTLIHFYIFHPDRVAAFYAPYARFFELLIGAFLAYNQFYEEPSKHPWVIKSKSIRAWIGLSLVLLGIQTITKQSHFPGWHALLSPVLGSALIISSSNDSWLNKHIFSNMFLVWIGLISYPLYLWHWPILSFGNIIASQTPTVLTRIILVGFSIMLASLTYYYLEKPIRFGKNEKSKQKTLSLIIVMLLLGALGYAIYINHGIIQRKSALPEIKNEGDIGHIIFHQYPYEHFYLCTPNNIQKEADSYEGMIRCFQSKKDAPIDIAIIGDSHAEHLFIGFAEALPEKNIVYYEKDTLPFSSSVAFKNIFDYIKSDKNIKTVILSAFWNRRKNEIPKNSSFEIELSKTLADLKFANKKIYIINDVPEFLFDPKQCKFIRPLSFKNNCIEDKKYFQKRYATYFPALEKLNKLGNYTLLNTVDLFCNDKYCSMKKDGKLLYRDSNHLSINGSRYVANQIVKQHLELAK